MSCRFDKKLFWICFHAQITPIFLKKKNKKSFFQKTDFRKLPRSVAREKSDCSLLAYQILSNYHSDLFVRANIILPYYIQKKFRV